VLQLFSLFLDHGYSAENKKSLTFDAKNQSVGKDDSFYWL